MKTQDREASFRNFFENSPDAILIQDLDGNVLECNPAATELHGMGRDQIIGKGSKIEGIGGDPPVDLEGFCSTLDGSSVPVWVRTSRIEYHGKPALLLHVRDITEYRNRAAEARKRLEREIQGAHKMEAVGRLAGGVAHDFNNLLTVIIGRCEVMLGRLSGNDPMRPDLSLIYEAAQKAASVTRQLLAFGRKQVLQPKILNLNAVIGHMEAMIRSLTSENVDLTTEFSKDILSIKADRGQIEQVLMNLVVNALDAMPGGGKLRIHTCNVELNSSLPGFGFQVRNGHYVMFSVQDTGRGMGSEILPHIFEPFFTTKDKTSGSGLGLPTVYGIIKQSGGYITAESRPGEGSTFKIYLPGFRVQAEPLDDAGDRIPVASQGTETILIAEDSDLVRQLTREMLEVRGYQVLEASNGEEALLMCKKHDGPIHLTLSDVVMPSMTGGQLAEQVTQLRPGMKVLLMSGYTDEITKAGFLQPGLHFIEKPFTSNSLALKIREMLDQPGD